MSGSCGEARRRGSRQKRLVSGWSPTRGSTAAEACASSRSGRPRFSRQRRVRFLKRLAARRQPVVSLSNALQGPPAFKIAVLLGCGARLVRLRNAHAMLIACCAVRRSNRYDRTGHSRFSRAHRAMERRMCATAALPPMSPNEREPSESEQAWLLARRIRRDVGSEKTCSESQSKNPDNCRSSTASTGPIN
jgi:hypothetical protein